MNPSRFQELKAVFVDLVERGASERELLLAGLAARDPELAIEARNLLRDSEETLTGILGRAPQGIRVATLPIPPHELVGRRVGPYRLTGRIGAGGMGAVYDAVRDEDGKRVAVKLLHGSEDPEELSRLIATERRILASLEHDNIARLIDGGVTEEGLHYFTMEHVEGRSIVEECDARELDVPSRLRLVRTLCGAVHYAHQRLVVHCDIKPSNVLVTRDGVPKLLDFGIARLVRPLEPEGDELTVALARALTPGYASPEQVRGEPITTATDVYALGLLLYELLAGEPAQRLEKPTPDELVRVVCEDEARRPTAVASAARRRALDGDLDAIVLKALRKDPAERYSSAEALANDLDRYLCGLPVTARRGSWTYRTRRYLRRNWLPVAAACVVAALATTTVVLTSLQARRIDRERQRAERTTELLVDVFQVSDPDQARGEAVTAREVLDRGASRIESELAGEPEIQAALLDTIGRVDVNLGLYRRAADVHRRALALRRSLPTPEDRALAGSLDGLGRALFYDSQYAEAEATHREALALRERQGGRFPAEHARTLDELAKAVGSQGRLDEAEGLHRQALELYRAAFGDEHPEVATGLSNLASDLYDQGKYAEAEALNRRALALRRRTLGDDHRLVAWSLNNLANCLQKLDRNREAEAIHREALAALERLHGGIHPDVALTLGNLAVDLFKQKRYAEAEATHREALALNRELLGDDSFGVAATLFNLAEVAGYQGRFDEMESFHRQALERFSKLFGPEHEICAQVQSGLAIALAAQGRGAEAEAASRAALAIQRRAHEDGQEDVVLAEIGLALSLAASDRLDEGEPIWRQAVSALGGEPPEQTVLTALERIASRFERSGRPRDAARCRRWFAPS